MTTKRFRVRVIAQAFVHDDVEVDIPVEMLPNDSAKHCAYARHYVDNLVNDNGITLKWSLDQIDENTIMISEAEVVPRDH